MRLLPEVVVVVGDKKFWGKEQTQANENSSNVSEVQIIKKFMSYESELREMRAQKKIQL